MNLSKAISSNCQSKLLYSSKRASARGRFLLDKNSTRQPNRFLEMIQSRSFFTPSSQSESMIRSPIWNKCNDIAIIRKFNTKHVMFKSLSSSSSPTSNSSDPDKVPIFLNARYPDIEFQMMVDNYQNIISTLGGNKDGVENGHNISPLEKKQKEDFLLDIIHNIGVYHWERGNLIQTKSAFEEMLGYLLKHSDDIDGSELNNGGDDELDAKIANACHFLGNIHARMATDLFDDNNDDDYAFYKHNNHDKGQLKEEAMKWYTKAMSMKQNLFGHYHPEVAKTMNGMAMLYAPPLPEMDSLDSTNKPKIDESESTMKSLESGMDDDTEEQEQQEQHELQQDFGRALKLLLEAKKIFIDSYNTPKHPHVLAVSQNIARLYMLVEHYTEASEEYTELLETKIQLSEEEGAGGGIFSFFAGNDENAEIRQQKYSIAMIHNSIGDCNYNVRKMEDAIKHWKAALEILEETVPYDDNDDLSTIEKEEMNSSITQNDFQMAKAVIYHKMGVAFSKSNKLEDALEWLEKSLVLKRKVGGEEHFEVGVTLNYMGAIYGTKDDKEMALSYFRRALDIFQKNADSADYTNDIHVMDALSNISLMKKT